MSTAPNRKFTVEEYLAREERSEAKHEYYRGEIFAMSGASYRHVQITGNTLAAFGSCLRGSPCQPLCSDMRLSVSAAGLYTYADISVIRGQPQFDPISQNSITNPVLLVEVVSPLTARYDCTHKFDFYKRIHTLKEYVLVAQDEARVEKFIRSENGGWTQFAVLGLESEVSFDSIGCTLRLADIYEGVELVEPLPNAEFRRPHE